MSDVGTGTDGDSAAIRDAVKWLLATSAGVLAVLTASLPFSSVGRLPFPRSAVAIALIGAGLAASLWIVLAAGRLLADGGLSFEDLVRLEVAAKQSGAAGTSQGAAPIGPVSDQAHLQRNSLLARLRDLDAQLRGGHARPVLLRDHLVAARSSSGPAAASDLLAAEQDVALYLTAANRLYAGDRFAELLRLVKRVGWVVPTAVVLFLLLGSSQPSSAAVTSGVAVKVFLNRPAGEVGFGAGCKIRQLDGVAVGGTLQEPVVAVPATKGCPARQLTVRPEDGVAVPKVE